MSKLAQWIETHDAIVLNETPKTLTVAGWVVDGTPDAHRVYLEIEDICNSLADAEAWLGY